MNIEIDLGYNTFISFDKDKRLYKVRIGRESLIYLRLNELLGFSFSWNTLEKLMDHEQ